MNNHYTKKIVITGPESTGKSTLSLYLSNFYNSIFYPEFARDYIANLNREYTFEDVEIIAKHQIKTLSKTTFSNNPKFVFYDTALIITKVWFQEVYGTVPKYIDDSIKNIHIDLYLLCYPDLTWVPDNLRENGGEARNYLFKRYIEELEFYKLKYFIIKGDAEKRFALAKEYLSSAYCL